MDVLVVGTVVVFLGGFLQGCLGFGFGLITVPPLLMVLTAAEVVPMQIGLSLMMSFPLGWRVRHHFQASLVVPLVVGAVLGLPVGMWILSRFDGPYLKLGVGVILVGMAVAMLTGWSRPVKRELLALFPIGFLAGVMQATFSMSGPPIILFLTNQSMDKERFRANMLVFFALIGTVSTTGFFLRGAYTQPVVERMVIFAGSVLVGGFLGARIAGRIPQEGFRTVTLVVAVVMGLMLFGRNLVVVLGG